MCFNAYKPDSMHAVSMTMCFILFSTHMHYLLCDRNVLPFVLEQRDKKNLFCSQKSGFCFSCQAKTAALFN